MSRPLVALTLAVLLLPGSHALAATAGYQPADAQVDLDDRASLQRGARTFVNYCLSCHAASFMRYSRLAEDLQLDETQVIDNLMFATDKIGDQMKVAMPAADAEQWFGVVPPDLSVIARARGPDWLYTYLMTFYRDDSRPFGMNNLMFPLVAMPHVLETMQGVQELREGNGAAAGGDPIAALQVVQPGTRNPAQFSKDMRDLVSFLTYLGEPAKLQRYDLGMKVILFLLVFTLLARALYKEYWKDVH